MVFSTFIVTHKREIKKVCWFNNLNIKFGYKLSPVKQGSEYFTQKMFKMHQL
jgi:hypothetical protein